MFKIVIVGFGHCGKNLHLQCMKKLLVGSLEEHISSEIHVVDPNLKDRPDEVNIHYHRTMPPAIGFFPDNPVVHICTPPDCHLANIQEALVAGYKYIIIEKPMASTKEDAETIKELSIRYSATVMIVAVWLNSTLTEKIMQLVNEEGKNQIATIEVIHNKSRFSRTFMRQNEHVFDIEMPHQLSVVLPFVDSQVELHSSRTNDLNLNGLSRVTMSRGEILLNGKGGVFVRLISNLNHPVRERSIVIQFKGGHKLVGNFPVSSDDSYSQLFMYTNQNILTKHEVYFDEPLTNCLKNYYEFFLKKLEEPNVEIPNGASLDFNLQIVTILHKAKQTKDECLPYKQEETSCTVAYI